MTDRELMHRYLGRLGLAVPPPPSWDGLKLLVGRHLQAIPFENLDVMAHLRCELTTAGSLHKIVSRGRGGFCYELNEAFGALLGYAGFTVKRIEARVWSVPQQNFGPPFDHLALVVSLPEGDFLTDVGFGDNNRTPLRLPEDEMEDLSGRYTLKPASSCVWRLARPDRPLYDMTLAAQPLEVFAPMHRFHQSSPESIFSKGLICTRATANGRITLSGERAGTLAQYFGIAEESYVDAPGPDRGRAAHAGQTGPALGGP
ncbi:MAG TPA: arylamine N-acetyltransferase [Steroidobacteraceae bacterium]|nr:arylamine N-acetyltransferase [Steroidobacteraceae bacterium]